MDELRDIYWVLFVMTAVGGIYGGFSGAALCSAVGGAVAIAWIIWGRK